MAIKIFAIPFDNIKHTFEDKDLQDFLLNKRVHTLKSEFFQQHGEAYWTVFVAYDPVFEHAHATVLSEPERMLYEKLQAWRKERAEKDGVPVFLVATNSEFTQIVQRAPKTLDGLRMVKGFGKKKADKYGKELLALVQAFYERKNTKHQQTNQPNRKPAPPVTDSFPV